MKEKIAFCWSGGKDSALALHRVLHDDRYEVVGLLTTCNEQFRRVSMHGVRIELAQQQARSIGLPLEIVFVGEPSTNEEYEAKMSECLRGYKAQGVTAVAFGDIFLEDLRRWRETNLERIGLRALFPLWHADTRDLIGEFLSLGFGSIICCVSDAHLDDRALGRVIDWDFINGLPASVDPCGENGEFHSFAFSGPIFKEALRIDVGEKVYRPLDAAQFGPKGFWFCDLIPATEQDRDNGENHGDAADDNVRGKRFRGNQRA